jgi:hypothetical protein
VLVGVARQQASGATGRREHPACDVGGRLLVCVRMCVQCSVSESRAAFAVRHLQTRADLTTRACGELQEHNTSMTAFKCRFSIRVCRIAAAHKHASDDALQRDRGVCVRLRAHCTHYTRRSS